MATVYRIMDANLNRAREGLRVAEEVARLVLEDAAMQKRIKVLRHGIGSAEKLLPSACLLQSRAADEDPGALVTIRAEKQRLNLQDLVRANLRRVQEAMRVLEEVSKLENTKASGQFKTLRFKAYDIERDLVACIEQNSKNLKAKKARTPHRRRR